ncbi:MAG: endonuclease domain-containing protein [Flavobacterium sp.]|nr:MAG: endonuclease domain-containing protein [Flavobacterium sp.]
MNIVIINERTITLSATINLPYNPKLKEKAKALRYAENLPEVLFWMRVSKSKFHGLDFDRQRTIGNYIVDFYIRQLSLVIEVDGSSHDFDGEYDEKREKYLTSLGLKVYRITVVDVLKNMDFVLVGLENYIVENYGAHL